MRLSSPKRNKFLRTLLVKRQALLKKLAGAEPLIVGNVYEVMRKCGNPTCHCAGKPGHLQTLLIYTVKGRRTCKLVRRKDEAWVQEAWLRYRNFKKALGELRTLHQQELTHLRVQMQKRRIRYE